jgi:hypothetical protein
VVLLSAPLARVYKAMYGAGGLSAQLWAMEQAELQNYWILRSEHAIGRTTALALSVYSLAKYARRVLVVALRRARPIE